MKKIKNLKIAKQLTSAMLATSLTLTSLGGVVLLNKSQEIETSILTETDIEVDWLEDTTPPTEIDTFNNFGENEETPEEPEEKAEPIVEEENNEPEVVQIVEIEQPANEEPPIEEPSKKTMFIPTEIPQNINHIELNVECWGNPAYVNELYATLQIYLPDGVKEFLRQKNITIYFVEATDGIEMNTDIECDENSDIRGLFSSAPNAIYIETYNPLYYLKNTNVSSEYDEYTFNYIQARDIMFHELGHYIDWNIDDEYMWYDISTTEEFAGIMDQDNPIYGAYQNDINNFRNTEEFRVGNLEEEVNISTPQEYFASAFAAYMEYKIDPTIENNLKDLCPTTYNIIETKMQEIEAKGYLMLNDGQSNYTDISTQETGYQKVLSK